MFGGEKAVKKYDVLTFGDLCVDLILRGGDVVPEFGQKEKLIGDYSLEMGGSCSIFACQTAKLGLNTVVVGKVGDDMFGDIILKTLADAGVSMEYVKKDKSLKTGISVALAKENDRAILTYSGTVDAVKGADIGDELLKSVRHLHIGSYFLMKSIQPHYPGIIRKVKEYGATVSLDTNWDPDEKWDSGIWGILPYVDIIFPNENEAMAITGESTADKAIERLKEIVPVVVVKKGKAGATTYAGGRILNVPAVDVEKIDAVGAGDSFDAGFVYGMLQGMGIGEATKIGCICGSLNTRCAGGTKGQPKLDEVIYYLERFDMLKLQD